MGHEIRSAITRLDDKDEATGVMEVNEGRLSGTGTTSGRPLGDDTDASRLPTVRRASGPSGTAARRSSAGPPQRKSSGASSFRYSRQLIHV
jgi:hypothetical protein